MIGNRTLLTLALLVVSACTADPMAPAVTSGEFTVNGLLTPVSIDRWRWSAAGVHGDVHAHA
jgi:hypothetical protein